MLEIFLNKDKIVIIDKEDYEKIKNYHWFVISNKAGQYYAIAKKMINRISTTYFMHHLIIGTRTEIDHVNLNGLDNRKENLRICNRSQNNMNHRARQINHTSKFKGVGFHKSTGKWRAFIRGIKKYEHLGLFNSEIEAARAYNQAAIKYFGEFSRLNELSET